MPSYGRISRVVLLEVKIFLAAEAIRDFIELNEWQVQEIQNAIAEADSEDFASEQTVQKTFSKWGVNAG